MHARPDRRRSTMWGLARHAAFYDRHAGFFAGPIHRRIVADVAAAGLPAGGVVLDVGTGPGRLPRLIAARCPGLAVAGIDLSAEMIAQAERAAEHGSADRAGIRFEVADVAALPFADASVDLVVSSISLHHWEDPAAGLRDIARVLKPGARAWIYDVRPALRRAQRSAQDDGAGLRLERRLPGSSWFSPLGRLVVEPVGVG